LPKNSGVRGATKAASAQDDADAHLFFVTRAWILRPRVHRSIGRSSSDGRNLGCRPVVGSRFLGHVFTDASRNAGHHACVECADGMPTTGLVNLTQAKWTARARRVPSG
jgi:hypothetical protein